MKISYSRLLFKLTEVVSRYDDQSISALKNDLRQLKSLTLPQNHSLGKYNNILIFICAHPADAEVLKLAEGELHRIATHFKKLSLKNKERWINSGLPYTEIVSNFSMDLVSWMIKQNFKVELNGFEEQGKEYKNILKITLPEVEKEITAVEDENVSLLNALRVGKKNILPFLLAEFERLKDFPSVKDYLFDALKLSFIIPLKDVQWCKSFNKLSFQQVFYHDQLLKKFDHVSLLNTPVNNKIDLNIDQRNELIRVCKLKLILLQRETEPVSYMDEKSLSYFELERGISIAFFTMIPERQLPVESYVGYTLFRNGYPAAYGGAWILGPRALFGINVFDWFRGGESGYILCQLLRTYRQVFSIEYFEVEPYQYGLGNPEGIESGAFWFYYKYGFRPLDAKLEKLAANEQKKIKTVKEYKTSKDTLERFTESNIALQLGHSIPIAMWQIRMQITEMIHKKFKDNRAEAEKQCIENFRLKTIFKRELDKHQMKVMTDVALMAEAYEWNSENIFRLLEQMVLEKPKDVYAHQKILLKLFQQIEMKVAHS